jgi:hypothetical protein
VTKEKEYENNIDVSIATTAEEIEYEVRMKSGGGHNQQQSRQSIGLIPMKGVEVMERLWSNGVLCPIGLVVKTTDKSVLKDIVKGGSSTSSHGNTTNNGNLSTSGGGKSGNYYSTLIRYDAFATEIERYLCGFCSSTLLAQGNSNESV